MSRKDDWDPRWSEFKEGDVVYDVNVGAVGTVTHVKPMGHRRFLYDHTGLGPGSPSLAFSDHLAPKGTVMVTDEQDKA